MAGHKVTARCVNTRFYVSIISCMVAVLMLCFCVSLSARSKHNNNDDEDTNGQRFPSGCYLQGFGYKHSVLHLYPPMAGKEQSMFFIHNLSMSTPINLYQMRTGEEPYVMNLNNKINANQWGVLATDEKFDKFICTVPKSGSKYGKIVDCKEYLDVCEYTNVKFSTINNGNYWVVDSSSMRGAQRSAISQGTLLRR